MRRKSRPPATISDDHREVPGIGTPSPGKESALTLRAIVDPPMQCYIGRMVREDASDDPFLGTACGARDGPCVYVVDDEPLVLRGMQRLLRSVGFIVRTFESPEAFLTEAHDDMAGCLVLDVQMPGVNGLVLQERLVSMGCHIPVIFLTGHGDVSSSVRAMKAGAVDFLTKPVPEKAFFDAINRALEKDAANRKRSAELADITRRVRTLTPREREVFSLVVSGMLNKQIAARLGVKEKTIKVHRSRVMAKMKVRSFADLVRCAARIAPSTPPMPASSPAFAGKPPQFEALP